MYPRMAAAVYSLTLFAGPQLPLSAAHSCTPSPLLFRSIRLPALVALVATQIGLLSTSLSLPMLAPLLLGTGMLMRSIRTNASLVFPRIGLLVVLLWTLWFANRQVRRRGSGAGAAHGEATALHCFCQQIFTTRQLDRPAELHANQPACPPACPSSYLCFFLAPLCPACSVIQNTVAYLRKQGAIDQRLANNINSAAELAVLVTASVIMLSMLGVNVSALLLPAGVALALAAKDLSHNFFAGFFLMMVQPFRRVGLIREHALGRGRARAAPRGKAASATALPSRAELARGSPSGLTGRQAGRHTRWGEYEQLADRRACVSLRGNLGCRLGDRVGVTLPSGSPGSFGGGGSWFEGVCEKVDLRCAPGSAAAAASLIC